MACFGSICRKSLRLSGPTLTTSQSILEPMVLLTDSPQISDVLNVPQSNAVSEYTVPQSIEIVDFSWTSLLMNVLIILLMIGLGYFIRRRTRSIKKLINSQPNDESSSNSEPMIILENIDEL